MLQDAGVEFDIRPAHVDEEAVKDTLLAAGAPLRDIADALAELKALRISSSHPDALVLGADQVLAFEGELISKCASLDEAAHPAAPLARQEARAHQRAGPGQGRRRRSGGMWKPRTLWMRDFSDGFLDDYLARKARRFWQASAATGWRVAARSFSSASKGIISLSWACRWCRCLTRCANMGIVAT